MGVGVQKAATTWLFRCLVAHPSIRSANVDDTSGKELNFFNHYYERGYCWYHRGFEFGPWRNLDFSILYFHDRNVPGRIHQYNPRARLVLALRNPVDRAISHHRHEIRRARLPRELFPFWKAAEQNPSYIEQGRYATHLQRWLEFVDLQQFLVIDHDDVRTAPGDVLRKAYAFLDVDPTFRPPSIDQQVNLAVVPRSASVEKALRWSSRTVRHVLGPSVASLIGRTGLPQRIRDRNRVVLDERHVPTLNPKERARLAAAFTLENARLGKLVGRDFSHWT